MRKHCLKAFIGVFLLSLGLAFAGCDTLEESDSPLEFALTNGSYTVVGLGSYEEGILTIPATYKGKPVTAIGEGAFKNEREIGHLYIPDSVKTIEADAFNSCVNLTKVVLGNGVTEIESSAFAYCNQLETLTMSGSLVEIGDSAFNACVRLKAVDLPDTLETIGANAFDECKMLETVNFGTGLKTIGERAFHNCIALQGIEIPDGAPTNIMGSAFHSCESVGYIRLGDNVLTVGDYAFYACQLTREVVLGDSLVSIGEGAFSACRKFYQITLGESLTTIGADAFDRCWLIREVYNRSKIGIGAKDGQGKALDGGLSAYVWYERHDGDPTRISKDENGLVYYTDGARKALVAIELERSTDIVVPDDVTEIADYAGYNEQYITSLVIGDGCTKIGENAFRNSYKIKKVIMGDSLETIGNYAFRYNWYIEEVVFGKKLKSVGKEAFLKKVGDKNCRSYKTLYYKGSPSEWMSVSFAEGNELLLADTVTLAYYSERMPATAGSYWYYENGKPTLWK